MDTRHFHNGKLVQLEAFGLTGEQAAPPTPRSTMHSPAEETPEKGAAPSSNEGSGALQLLVSSCRFLVLSLPSCPQCDTLAEALATRGVPPSVFVKWDKGSAEYPTLKAALAIHAGDKFTFPQVFADDVYQGGFQEAMAKVEDGSYDELFLEAFSVAPTTVQRLVKSQAMVVLSLPSCPQCDVLRAELEQRGLPVQEIFVKWDKAMSQYQSLKTQLIQLIGVSQFTFPQTFVSSQYQGSFHDVMEKLNSGHFDAFFSEAFGIAKPAAPASLEAAAIAFDEDF